MNGWVFIHKPEGPTSFSVVRDMRRCFSVRRVGHAGTLDPLASGVLAIAIGEACKLMPYVSVLQKTYTFRVVWGQERSTDDAEGDVVHTSTSRPSLRKVQDVLPQFLGDIEQRPPRYCAINIQGERAYRLARAGKDFVMPLRRVVIHALEARNCSDEAAEFFVECSSGTYVRALGRDIARALGTCGYVDRLCRTSLGSVVLEDCCEGHQALAHLKPAAAFWDPDRVLVVDDGCLTRLSHGQKVPYKPLLPGPWLVRAQAALPACVVLWREGCLESQRFLHGAAST